MGAVATMAITGVANSPNEAKLCKILAVVTVGDNNEYRLEAPMLGI
jgi:hypothetical protein